MKKDKSWVKFRHKVITALLRPVLGTYTRLAYNIKVEKIKDSNKRQYLIIMNHQTGLDQFIMGMAVKRPVYYIASEDLFSNGFISRLLMWLVAPIPIKKQTTDVHAVMNCLRVAREGGNIGLAPEGNRTYSGRTGYFNPALVKLMRKLKLPMAVLRIEGGYGTQPRWSNCIRRGKMKATISRVIEFEEYSKMTDEALYELVGAAMYVDENKADRQFKSNKRAEFIERAMYVCPKCGLSTFLSKGNRVSCLKCGLTAQYNEDKTLSGENWPFTFPGDWYDYQTDYVNSFNSLENTEKVLYTEKANLSQVFLYKRKQLIKKDVTVELYPHKAVINNNEFPFNKVDAFTVLGKNKLNVYFENNVYQLRSDKHFNALKYVNLFHRYKNLTEGNENDKFLGL